ncbi:MAG: AAA family ATPase [Candidatus Oxydemutatoraceae bacterium WSBS_2016_MAG_OTU14]
MKIKFKENHESIKEFKEKEIKDFSIFTGVNGSGKTHLLTGIEEGQIEVEGIEPRGIVYFDYLNFSMQGSYTATNSNELNWRVPYRSSRRSLRQSNFEGPNPLYIMSQYGYASIPKKEAFWQQLQDKNSLICSQITKYDNQIKKSLDFPLYPYNDEFSLGERISKRKHTKECKLARKKISEIICNFFLENSNINSNETILKKAATEFAQMLLSESMNFLSEIEKDDFNIIALDGYPEYSLLNNLSGFFNEHQRKIIDALQASERKGDELVTKDEIKKLEEEAPWNIINAIFKNFGMEHKVIKPDFKAKDILNNPSYSFSTNLIIDNQIIDFNKLSSGEKILCALAFTIFQENKSAFPELILLDEIDATIHPSTMKELFDVIHNVFIKNGSKVIMATHSPSTIAHAPEDAIFEIKKGNVQNKIVEISKKDAINILTSGFASFESGLTFLDSMARKELSILTEGNNVNYINKAIDLFIPELQDQIEVIETLQDISSKEQLKALFISFSRMQPKKKFLFVWDCDCNCKTYRDLEESSNIFPFIFSQNKENNIASNGVENLFSEESFPKEFYKIIQDPELDSETKNFKGNKKAEFFQHACKEGTKESFVNFKPLCEKIKNILTPQ